MLKQHLHMECSNAHLFVQVRMAWKDEEPPKGSNYDVAYKWLISSEKTFNRKDCLEVTQAEDQKLVEQGFVKEATPEQINHETREWSV